MAASQKQETTERLSKSEVVYRALRRRILDGTHSFGYRLVLGHIAKEFGVSTVPVREGIRRLEAEGLVRFTPNVGAEVSGVNRTDYADAMQTLAYLEGAATSLASAHLTQEDLTEAGRINDEMRVMSQEEFDPVLFTDLNHQFHAVLCGRCPNLYLGELLKREWERIDLIRRSSFTYVPGRSKASVKEHDLLLGLLREGAELDEIEQMARNHKLGTMGQFLSRVGMQGHI